MFAYLCVCVVVWFPETVVLLKSWGQVSCVAKSDEPREKKIRSAVKLESQVLGAPILLLL